MLNRLGFVHLIHLFRVLIDYMYDLALVTIGNSEVRKRVEELFCNPVVIICEEGRKETLDKLEKYIAEGVGILLTYRCPYIIPQKLYSRVLGDAYNIHPSLLPNYPGINPWKEIMKDENQMNGVSIHRMEAEADKGQIILQRAYSIAGMDYIEARKNADLIASELLIDLFLNLKLSD